jgi:hypothetical protein
MVAHMAVVVVGILAHMAVVGMLSHRAVADMM